MRNARAPIFPHVIIGIVLFGASMMAALLWVLDILRSHASMMRGLG